MNYILQMLVIASQMHIGQSKTKKFLAWNKTDIFFFFSTTVETHSLHDCTKYLFWLRYGVRSLLMFARKWYQSKFEIYDLFRLWKMSSGITWLLHSFSRFSLHFHTVHISIMSSVVVYHHVRMVKNRLKPHSSYILSTAIQTCYTRPIHSAIIACLITVIAYDSRIILPE